MKTMPTYPEIGGLVSYPPYERTRRASSRKGFLDAHKSLQSPKNAQRAREIFDRLQAIAHKKRRHLSPAHSPFHPPFFATRSYGLRDLAAMTSNAVASGSNRLHAAPNREIRILMTTGVEVRLSPGVDGLVIEVMLHMIPGARRFPCDHGSTDDIRSEASLISRFIDRRNNGSDPSIDNALLISAMQIGWGRFLPDAPTAHDRALHLRAVKSAFNIAAANPVLVDGTLLGSIAITTSLYDLDLSCRPGCSLGDITLRRPGEQEARHACARLSLISEERMRAALMKQQDDIWRDFSPLRRSILLLRKQWALLRQDLAGLLAAGKRPDRRDPLDRTERQNAVR